MAAIMCDPNAGTLQPNYYNEVDTMCEWIVEYCLRNGLRIESQQVTDDVEEKFFSDTGKELTKTQANQRAALDARGVHSPMALINLAAEHIIDELHYLDTTQNSEGGRLLTENARKGGWSGNLPRPCAF
ncbi:Hypothetical protein, putative [Bodo saltans]|uniref:Uncharacterized protein n=1 Tax=Bodo saltans TaxID=75058 RepID=A0A0S4KKC6_BODSA|nr:Hypothetical protein, putative [Bodo saltans]|eukprot:CUI15042.1 Hypothetical protein, putative [Bodo saltans]